MGDRIAKSGGAARGGSSSASDPARLPGLDPRTQREQAATQIQRTLRVWRKASGEEPEEKAEDEEKKDEKAEGEAGEKAEGKEGEAGEKAEAKEGGEESAPDEKPAEVSAKLEGVGLKVFLEGEDKELQKWCRKVKMDANSDTTKQLFASRAMTVKAYIGQYRKGGVNSVLPKEAEEMTVEAALRAGEVGGVNVRKLLTDGREKFAK